MNKIFYCRVGWMRSYCGAVDEKPGNGGSYNKNNTGYAVYNFLGNKGRYYGFVEAGVDKTINIKKLDGNNDYAENITVVWIAKSNEAKGQRIVGWYKDAKVFKQLQKDIPEDVMEERDKAFNIYNIYAEKAVLLDVNDRKYIVKGMGQSNIWYGNEDENKKVEKIIETYEKDKSDYLEYKKDSVKSAIILASIILAISLVEIYLMMRASFLSRIKEIGVFRAIGVKKSDIYRMFLGEIIAITVFGSVPGIALMTYILASITKIQSASRLFIVNFQTIGLSVLIIFGVNILVGLLPLFKILRKRPARILARHDVE